MNAPINVPANNCPVCLRKLDLATDPLGDAVPRPGDVSMCIYCTTVLVFQDDMSLVLCPQEILDECQELVNKVLATRAQFLAQYPA